ncbi:MAG TPA: hypothetical protein VGQ57_09440 [Polyangiaceae bacterium]|nr:hypothetical protein [Polyangiaceae bacterium]
MANAKWCDDPNCEREADFMYVWPGTEARYAGCSKHATMAKHAVANMGRELQLIPLDEEAAAAAAGAPLGSSSTGASSADVQELIDALHALPGRIAEAIASALNRGMMPSSSSSSSSGAGATGPRT